jgi:hypothetical protein
LRRAVKRFYIARYESPVGNVEFGGLIADKAFDSNAIIADLDEGGAKVVVSQHPRRAAMSSEDPAPAGQAPGAEIGVSSGAATFMFPLRPGAAFHIES